MRKGITPIISIIILLLITMALVGTAWAYMSGFIATYTEQNIAMSPGSAFCGPDGNFRVTVLNTGTNAVPGANIKVSVIGNTTWGENMLNNTALASLGPRESSVYVSNLGPANGSFAGSRGAPGHTYTVSVGAGVSNARQRVTC